MYKSNTFHKSKTLVANFQIPIEQNTIQKQKPKWSFFQYVSSRDLHYAKALYFTGTVQ